MKLSEIVSRISPSLKNRISIYRNFHEFSKDFELMKSFIKGYHPEINNDDSNSYPIGVIITPWMYTAVPWYALSIAFMLKDKGNNVHLIWDDLVYDDLVYGHKGSTLEQNKKILQILNRLEGIFHIEKLSSVADADLNEKDVAELRRLAKLNAIHRFQTSISSEIIKRFEMEWYQLQHNNLKKIKSFFGSNQYNQLIFAGGMYGNSGLYVYIINDKSKIATYDAGDRRALICVNGIAGYQDDLLISLCSKEIQNASECVIEKMIVKAKEEFDLRLKGIDAYSTQIQSFDNSQVSDSYDIIMPLNITWDLPALGKHCFFENDFDWIVETVRYILENTDAKVAVRQHPHERRKTSGRDFKREIENIFGAKRKFKFIDCNEPINSYSLINHAKIVLPYASTIGIEAALMNKTVIMESDCYYSNLNFVTKASTKEDYFFKIKTALNQAPSLNEEQFRCAWICYYLTQQCTAVETDFTPFIENFRVWLKKGYKDLKENEVVQSIIQAISEKTPVLLLNHRKNMENS